MCCGLAQATTARTAVAWIAQCVDGAASPALASITLLEHDKSSVMSEDLARLSAIRRETFVLFELEGLSGPEIAEGIKLTSADADREEFDLVGEPLFRLHDPAREHSDGTVWAYGKTGRPAALLTLALHPRSDGTLGWLYEWNSLSSQGLSVQTPTFGRWAPPKSASMMPAKSAFARTALCIRQCLRSELSR